MNIAQKYYDAFSKTYETHRHYGYHQLLDEIESSLVLRYCRQGKILDAGCGTGLVAQRLSGSDRQVFGIDLSAGMLSHARQRSLSVVQGTLDALPFHNDTFDAVVSFKVLAHIPPIQKCLAELARVTRPGGHLVLEFYNKNSLRYLVKRLKHPSRTSGAFTDEDVYTRYDTVDDVLSYLPPSVSLHAIHGIRTVTPVAQLIQVPVLGRMLTALERQLVDAPVVRRLGGFLVIVAQKRL